MAAAAVDDLNWSDIQRRFLEALASACMRIVEGGALLLQQAAPMLLRVAQAVEQIEKLPPVKGYEPFLIEDGRHPIVARALAYAINKLGEELLEERLAERSLASAIVSLAKAAGASSLVISRRAKVLGRALNEALVEVPLRNACAVVGLSMSIDSLQALVGRAIDRDDAACQRLVEISRMLRRRLRDPRGRVPSIASVSHELFLHLVKRAYTVDLFDGDMTDPATSATRTAIGDPDFDPRPARRRLRARQSLQREALRCRKGS
jgi:hypothetical protein